MTTEPLTKAARLAIGVAEKRWHVEEADCRPILRELDDASFDAVISDWPYGVDIAEWDKAAPYEQLPEFLRIARGAVVLFGAAPRLRVDLATLNPAPDRVLMWAPAFTLAHTQSSGVFYRYHPIYCWRIPKKHEGPKHDVLRHNTMGRNEWNHSCTKPEKLMADLAGFAPLGGTILDPYCGSGSTLVGALRRGRRCGGIELDAAHAATSRARCEAETSLVTMRSVNLGQSALFPGAK